jgi:hypothetical protein
MASVNVIRSTFMAQALNAAPFWRPGPDLTVETYFLENKQACQEV